jgi:hypothetical protein
MVPTTSGTTYDYEYSLKSGHPFFAKTYKETLVIPNCIVVKSNPSDETQYSATYTEASYSLMPVTQFEYCSLESNEQAAAIAAALIYKYAIQADGGAAQVPVNCGAEVLDYVKVTDEREEDSLVGNLGTIHRHYNFELPYLRMTFSFGGWLTHRDLVNQISALSSGEGTLQSASYNQLSAKEAWIGKLGVDELDIQWIDPEGNIDLSLIGDNLDNLPDGEVYGRVKQTHLEAGALKLDEFVVYKPGYDPSTKQKEITKSPVPPTNPAINDLWLDTSVSPNALKQWTGATWKVCSATNLDQLPDGVAYRRVASSALTANGLVVLDNVQIGQYGLVKNTDISAGHINLSSCLGTLDNIQDGTTFGRLYQTDIRSGHIALTSYTKAEGKWYNEGGVTIDVADGIVVAYGSGKVQLNSEGLKGVYNGIMQVKIDSTTGEMIAGAGAVKLGSYGLKTYNGTALQCYIGTDGKIVGAGGNFQLGANFIDIYVQCLEFYQSGGGVPAAIILYIQRTLT